MKPTNIFLIRHGQSVGNVNKQIYKTIPDYALELTEEGRRQAHSAGKELKKIIGKYAEVKFYVSPFWRTRQTYKEIEKWFEPYQIQPTYEDPRLREQEWGHKAGKAFNLDYEKERNEYGHFYWRFPDGESCADVYDRVSDFLQTLYRDFQKESYAENVIIVTHGMAMRLFLMRWLHFSVEKFEKIKNPKNCEWYNLRLDKDTDKYKLTTPLLQHVVTHPFQFPEYKTLPLD